MGSASARNPSSKETISDPVVLCEAAVCRLAKEVIGINALGPTKAKKNPLVDLLVLQVVGETSVALSHDVTLARCVTQESFERIVLPASKVVHQATESPVARLCPLRYPPGEVATRPKVAKADETAAIEQLRDDVSCIFGQLPSILKFFRRYLMIIDAWVCHLLESWLISCFCCKLLVLGNTLVKETIHLPPC